LLLQEETSLEIQGYITGEKSEEIFEKLQKQAVRYGHNLFLELKAQYEEYLQKEREKGQYAFQSRRQAIMRIGLTAVRQHRLAELERQEKEWTLRLKEKEKILPELSAIIIVYIEGGDS
jgi:predicted NAD/FAD-dependent oxidoreductase